MVFPILGGNSAVAGYSIDNSLRFNDGDSAYLSRDFSGASRQTFTFSTWFKRSQLSTTMTLFSSGTSNTERTSLFINSDDTIRFFSSESAAVAKLLVSSAVLRDSSAFYHFLLRYDSTDATASNRIRFYLNGNEMSYQGGAVYPAQNNATGYIGSNDTHGLGCLYYGATQTEFFDGYLAETHFIDGQALSPTDFGEFDEDSGIWKPIRYTGTYGTNGFYLPFNTGTIGEDLSGNSNDFTATNLSATTDITTDTPTNNFATMNPLILRTASSPTFSEGNCKVVQSASNGLAFSSISVSSGKWYVEVKVDAVGGLTACGIIEPSIYDNGNPDTQSITYQNSGNKKNLTTSTSYGASYTTGDIIGIAFDADNGTLEFYKNGASQGTAFTGLDTTTDWIIGCLGFNGTASNNYGNPSFSISSGNSDDNGYGNFEYAPPTGYLSLCSANLATELSPTIDDGSEYFNTVLYTGTGSSLGVTGVGFKPDWTWIKGRSGATEHVLTDSSRGVTEELSSNDSGAEETVAQGLTAFGTDGFTVGTDGSYNTSSATYASWNWLAGGGSVSNSDGTISSQVNVNQTAGFSIVTYTGTGSVGTVGHGLGKVPKVLITKDRDDNFSWNVYHAGVSSDPETDYLVLEGTDAVADNVNRWNDTAPTSSVFTVASSSPANTSGNNILAYCFAEIEGYSKFGSHTGNGSSDGTFVYTGFRPAFLMIKRTDGIGNWVLVDTSRNTNGVGARLYADLSDSEYSGDRYDQLSNGFKIRTTSTESNASGGTYIYMAFAENPFVTSTGVPVTAR